MANTLSLDRIGKVTGSRIAGILGVSPYRTRAEVMREMVREAHFYDTEFDGNFATEWGQEHELDGIADYEMLNGVKVEFTGDQQVTLVKDIFAVTPDGLTPDVAVEVKAPFRATYTHIDERPDYKLQCGLICEVAEREAADFVVWRPTGTSISRYQHDDSWLPSVMPELERFLEEYNATVGSEELSAPYLEGIPGYRYDLEWLEASAELLDLMAEQDRINKAVMQLQVTLEALSPEQSAKGGGIHLVYRRPAASGKGSVSYKSLAEGELGAERVLEVIDKYRSAPPAGGGRGSYSFRRLETPETK